MRKFSLLATGLVVAVGAALPARAAEVTLTVHHFLSATSPAQVSFMQPWADRVAKQSNGRIKVEIYPSMSMGGKPPELYRQVRDGAADIVWTLIGYTPGVFPRSEVYELPTVHGGSAEATNLAIQDTFKLVADDFKDLKPLLVHVHAGNAIHTRDKMIQGVDDLRGLKLRTPSRTGAWLIESWGAEPVGMPVPALPEALSKGTVDGALVPFEIFLPLKLQDLTKYSVEGEDGSRFGTSVFLYAMNKERYEGLPADLRKVIDDNSGAAIAADVGRVWNEVEAPGLKAQEASGGKVIKLSAQAKAMFDERGKAVEKRWIEDAKGFDGAALVAAARAAVQKHSKR
jgi:TRAP-type C4-dicarboxylate transport system substrate-binding protein